MTKFYSVLLPPAIVDDDECSCMEWTEMQYSSNSWLTLPMLRAKCLCFTCFDEAFAMF